MATAMLVDDSITILTEYFWHSDQIKLHGRGKSNAEATLKWLNDDDETSLLITESQQPQKRPNLLSNKRMP